MRKKLKDIPQRISVAELRRQGIDPASVLGRSPSRQRRERLGRDGTPLEEAEQRDLAGHLDALGLQWSHFPNGGARCLAEGGKLKAQGTKAGVPDNFIFDAPPGYPGAVGTVIELKRACGGRASREQKEWLEYLAGQGWIAVICHGAAEAKELVRKLGYEERARVLALRAERESKGRKLQQDLQALLPERPRRD